MSERASVTIRTRWPNILESIQTFQDLHYKKNAGVPVTEEKDPRQKHANAGRNEESKNELICG